jgi:hypothetical protein
LSRGSAAVLLHNAVISGADAILQASRSRRNEASHHASLVPDASLA